MLFAAIFIIFFKYTLKVVGNIWVTVISDNDAGQTNQFKTKQSRKNGMATVYKTRKFSVQNQENIL